MAIPAILKGDTSGSIVLDIKAGYEYEGCTLAVVFNGVRKEFTGLAAGGTKSLQYTADETAGMPLGTAHATMTLTNAAGVVRSMPWVRIRVTDIPAEIYDRHIDVDPSQLDVEPAKAGDSLGEVKAKLNAVMAFLRGGAACLLACVGLASFGDIGPTTLLNDVPGDTTISNLVVKSGVSTGGGGGGITAQDATNAATAVVERDVPGWARRATPTTDTNTVAEIANHAISTNSTVSSKIPMTNETGTAWVGWDGDILTFSYGIRVNQSPSYFASTEGTYFGGESLQALLDSKRDIGDNDFYEDLWLYDGNLYISSPFGVYSYFVNIGLHNNFDEGWSNITVSTFESIETLPEYIDRNISTNNPSFVSAILSTGLNIDTNDVAVIKAFVENWPVDPATGATTLGGLLTAIAAAIAWMKKNKRDISNRQWGERTFSNPVASLEGAVFNRIEKEHDTEYALFFNYDGDLWHGYFDPSGVGDDWLSITLDKNNIFSDGEPQWDESLGDVIFTRTATQDTFALTSEIPEVPTDAKITSLAREATESMLPYALVTVDETHPIADRAINTTTSGTFVMPKDFTDLLIRFSGAPVGIDWATNNTGITDIRGDDLPSESGDYLITITRTKAAEAYVRVINIAKE